MESMTSCQRPGCDLTVRVHVTGSTRPPTFTHVAYSPDDGEYRTVDTDHAPVPEPSSARNFLSLAPKGTTLYIIRTKSTDMSTTIKAWYRRDEALFPIFGWDLVFVGKPNQDDLSWRISGGGFDPCHQVAYYLGQRLQQDADHFRYQEL